MHDTTFPVFETGFSHHDSHPYANDDRWKRLVPVGLLATIPAVVAFVALLLLYTPR